MLRATQLNLVVFMMIVAFFRLVYPALNLKNVREDRHRTQSSRLGDKKSVGPSIVFDRHLAEIDRDNNKKR